MKHEERKTARRYDMAERCREAVSCVYGGDSDSCYGFMGGKITLDFRINGHYMGEEIKDENDERTIYYRIKANEKIDTVTLVKMVVITSY